MFSLICIPIHSPIHLTPLTAKFWTSKIKTKWKVKVQEGQNQKNGATEVEPYEGNLFLNKNPVPRKFPCLRASNFSPART